MQMRIDGDQPVDVLRQQFGEQCRSHRFAVLKAFVLAHVAKIRCSDADAGGAELARGGGGKQQGQRLVIGLMQAARQNDLASAHRAVEAQIGFTVGEAAHLQCAGFSAGICGQRGGQCFVAGQRENDGVCRCAHWPLAMATIGGCAYR